MKKLLYISFIITLFIAACDVLDVDPKHSIPADEAIRTPNDVVRAVNGCYDALQSVGYYGRNYIVAGDISADNLNHSGTTGSYAQIANNNIFEDNVIVEGIWSSIYDALKRINLVIDRIPSVDGFTEEEANEVLAEMYFLRALAHFDLVRMFGPVPIRTAPVTMAEEDLNTPRRSVEAVYAQVFDDLDFALEHISANIVRGRASKAAALALQARVSMHYYGITQQASLLTGARDAAGEVIEEFGLSLVPVFSDLYTNENNTESIFEIEFNEQDRNRMAEYFFVTALSGRHEFEPTQELFDAYDESADVRRDASIVQSGSNLYGFKYNDIETGTDNIYVFRLAEMYLTRAEANTLLGGEASVVQQDINQVRQRAGLVDFEEDDTDLLLLEIENQRRLEFAFEGHRWFDLIRTHRTLEVLESVESINQTLFPIPLNELLTNDHPEMHQNEGY